MKEVISKEAEVEEELYHLMRAVLDKHNYKISEVEFKAVKPQYSVDGGVADLVVLLADGTRILEIECKRKAEGFRAIRDFDVLGSKVLNQALFYASRIGAHTFATTNGERFAMFRSPERGEPFRLDTHRLLIKEKFSLKESDVEEILRFVAQWYRHIPVPRTEIDWLFITRLRSFVDFLSRQLGPVIKSLEKDGAFSLKLRKLAEKVGGITTAQLAREAAYLLMNKLVFYKILERHYRDLPKLKGISAPDGVSFVEFLKTYFYKAIEVTKDFEPVFVTEVYDDVPLPNLDYVFEEVNSFIEDMDTYNLEEIGSDVVGYIYQELIPDEERHTLGQFYTPPSIAELIVKWAIRNPCDTVMDPAVGSGTFLVKAYMRLAELKLANYKRKGVKARPAGFHKEILSQLYADDINPFPAHLTAMNLAMRDVRYPTSEMNVIVEDFFNIGPKQKVLAPYVIKTPSGEFHREVIIPKVDAVVANPPYTRWVEIPKKTQDAITDTVGETLKKYGITGGIGTETGIYVHFISYALSFLKKKGRVGMIISNSWLQADYGVNFANFLLDHFKVKAVVDFNQRLFRIPLIATCVLLLESEENSEARDENKTTFLYVDKEAKVEEILDAIENPKAWADRFLLNTLKQRYLPRDEKWIKMMFKTDEIEKTIRASPLIISIKDLFEPRYGNLLGVSARGGTGADKFFYLTEREALKWGLMNKYLHSLLASPRYSKFFTYTDKDWRELKNKGKPCYVFICHEPKGLLPKNVKNFIEWGEKEPLVRVKQGEEPKTANESTASMTRERNKRNFYGWYDLGDVEFGPIHTSRRAQYYHRFVLSDVPVALDDSLITFIPKQKIKMNEELLKALLAFLNSDFSRFFTEIGGRTTGGGVIELDVKSAEKLPTLNVRKLSQKQVKEFEEQFLRLESETRKIGGADTQENLEKLQAIIENIDAIVAKALGLDKRFATDLRRLTRVLSERRVSRTIEARPEAIKGEEAPVIEPPKKPKRVKKEDTSVALDRFIS